MKLNKCKKVVKENLCTSCGLCSIHNNASMTIKKGIYIPLFKKQLTKEEEEFLFRICPGKGYPIVTLGKKLFPKNNYDYRIGYYTSYGVARSFDTEFLVNSTSGGMMPALALYLLESGFVNGIITVKYEYSKKGPLPKPFIAKTKKDLIESQGSKYQPIPLLKIIDEVLEFDGNLAVIGTPCQIAGIRLLQNENIYLKSKIKYTISNFCGGYRDFRETERIFQLNRISPSNIEMFSYRSDGQPGFMRIKEKGKPLIKLKYPDYSRLTGFKKYNRCRLCVDATGELADISFGDAWLPNYLKADNKWSAYIIRSKKMKNIINELVQEKKIELNNITKEELIKSQQGNIITKKERQNSRYKLFRFLGKKTPSFDGGYNSRRLNILFEIKVLASQQIMYLLERTGLYTFMAKLIKRI